MQTPHLHYFCSMQQAINSVLSLYKKWSGQDAVSIDVLPASGSERRYFRLFTKDGSSVIGTYGSNIKENEAFFYFSDQFYKKQLPVASIHAISENRMFYLQEDFGDVSLVNLLESTGYTDEIFSMFTESLRALARLQVQGDNDFDYERCLTNKEFGKQAIMADLLYFKYYFLDALRKPYDKQKLIDDFDTLSSFLSQSELRFFMFRDFQSRNIMVKDSNIHFIDYQGGMKGAPHYDVASMLWQARADLPNEWKEKLLDQYISFLEEEIGQPVNIDSFKKRYQGYVLIRLLQVLGAYGFRGLFERKAHFLTSIPLALSNLKYFLNNYNSNLVLQEFQKVLGVCVEDEVINHFTPVQATNETLLVVRINSFSYKNGIPEDSGGNGGGFVFDCRGILNPGRLEEFKSLTGRNKDVMDFLQQQTRMPEYLNSVFDIVDITVEDYLKRNFESLQISFGCTGGQHRSVFAADALARHLRNKFKVKVTVNHREQNISEQKGF